MTEHELLYANGNAYHTIIKADGITFFGSSNQIAFEFGLAQTTIDRRIKQLSKKEITIEELFGTKPAGIRKMNKYLAAS